MLLRDPFAKERGFQAVLKSDQFTALETLAKEGYFTECDFHLIAKIDQHGRAVAEVRCAGGKKLFAGQHDEIADKKDAPAYKIPPLSFELWEFNLSSKGFAVASKQTTLQGLKAWLAQFGGVRLYHRGVRVMPYGEQKNDWLDMNLRRSQHQELRPSTNNSAGCVRIEDPSGVFQQKTDRMGFMEGDAFDALRSFADNVLSWMSGEREKDRRKRLKADAEKARLNKSVAENEMDAVIAALPLADKQKVKKAADNVRAAHEAEVKIKDETAQLYFTLGTVGTTAAAFAHQTKQPLRGIVADARDLENYLGNPNELLLFRDDSSKAVKRILLEANAIYSFSNVTLRLLEHEKRRSARHSIHKLIDETVELLAPYLEARETTVVCDYANDDLRVWCPRAAFEAIFTNLLTNSLQAFEARARSGAPAGVRRIHVQTQRVGDTAIIRVQDNGPGIDKLAIEEIWLPGKTTTEKGTGLGLTIVKDVTDELRGASRQKRMANSEEHALLSHYPSKADMPLPTLSNRRIAVFEDNPRSRERLSDMVTRCGAIALPVDGSVPKLIDLKTYLDAHQINMVVCDHHLSQQKDYAPFLGAEAIAECYNLGIAGILVTAFEQADAESSLRFFRRHIPALVRSPEDLDRANLEAALLYADREVREKLPSRERIPHRTIMTIQHIEIRGSTKVVKVVMSQWGTSQEVGFPLNLVPKDYRSTVKPGNLLIAQVNIEAARQEDLFFDKFELPDANALQKAKTIFGLP